MCCLGLAEETGWRAFVVSAGDVLEVEGVLGAGLWRQRLGPAVSLVEFRDKEARMSQRWLGRWQEIIGSLAVRFSAFPTPCINPLAEDNELIRPGMLSSRGPPGFAEGFAG